MTCAQDENVAVYRDVITRKLLGDIEILLEQRIELLAALKELALCCRCDGESGQDALEDARVVIAEVESSRR